MSINAAADSAPYNEILTAYAVELGTGGPFAMDELAPISVVETQEYAMPNYGSPTGQIGYTQTAAKSDGSLNVRTSGAPTFVPGKCNRRGLKSDIKDEDRVGPHAALFADEQVETARNVEELRLETEIAGKAALDVLQGVSLHNATPTNKWDDVAQDPYIINAMEQAARQAELNSGMSLDSDRWRWVIPPAVGDVIRQYLRTKLIYTDAQMQVGGMLPERIANIRTLVPGRMYNTAAAGQTVSVGRVWSSDDVYLVYVDPTFSQAPRTFTALSQRRWNKISPSFAVQTWRPADLDINKTWVAVDIYDSLDTISQHGIYVLKHVLTTETA